MLNEAVIDYWADIYRACRLQTEVSFEVFLTDPWRYLRQFGQETAPALIAQGLRPLLPAQARVARKLAIASIVPSACLRRPWFRRPQPATARVPDICLTRGHRPPE